MKKLVALGNVGVLARGFPFLLEVALIAPGGTASPPTAPPSALAVVEGAPRFRELPPPRARKCDDEGELGFARGVEGFARFVSGSRVIGGRCLLAGARGVEGACCELCGVGVGFAGVGRGRAFPLARDLGVGGSGGCGGGGRALVMVGHEKVFRLYNTDARETKGSYGDKIDDT